MFRLISILIGYAVGCVQTAYIVGRLWHKDIRQYGSGNLGTTNALRVLGKKAGAITFVCDILKGVIAFTLCYQIFGKNIIAGIYAGAGVILGHDFPFFLNFKGGKGIAVTIGIVFCLTATISPLIAAVSFGIGIIGVVVKGYVSMGSILFVCTIPIMCAVCGAPTESIIIISSLSALALFQHRANMARIIHGSENSLYKKKTN